MPETDAISPLFEFLGFFDLLILLLLELAPLSHQPAASFLTQQTRITAGASCEAVHWGSNPLSHLAGEQHGGQIHKRPRMTLSQGCVAAM